MEEKCAIAFENVCFAYNGGDATYALSGYDSHLVLHEASFQIERGEFVAIMGNNGSGKSTLAMLACAAFQPRSGTVYILGKDTQKSSQFDIRRHIGFVMQNPDDQLVASIVENEVAFGPENLGLSAEECRERVGRALSHVGLAGFEKREVNSLSGGQKQRVAIAGALAMNPEILIFDEATSMLDEPSRKSITELARSLADAGAAVLMITHSADDAIVADRVMALASGRIVIDNVPAAAFANNRLQRELGWPHEPFAWLRDASRQDGERTQSSKSSPDESANLDRAPLVELRDVSFSYSDPAGRNPDDGTSDSTTSGLVLQSINIEVRQSDLLAIVGPTGSGKSTIIQLMNGLLEPSCGTVLIDGTPLEGRHSANIARRQVGLVFQYPEHQMFTSRVYDEVSYGPHNMGLSQDEADARAREALEAVGLPFDQFAERNPFTLSGGEQRRVAIASVLAMRPKVLALDEPCAGLDPSMHFRFLQLLCRLHDAGQTIVIVSHEMADVDAIATKVFELH